MTRSHLYRLRPALGVAAAMMSVWGLVYSFPLFVLPLAGELHADRAQIAGIVVALLAWGAIAGPPLGALVDRVGPRASVLVGLAIAVVGFAAFSQAHALWQAYLSYAVVLGSGQTLIYLGCNVLIARSFAGERATAFGIAYAGLGIGTGLYAIGGQLLIAELGWRQAALLLAFTPLLVVPGIVRLHSASRIDGERRTVGPAAQAAGSAVSAARAAAGIGAFVLIFVASTMLGLADEGIYQNLLPHAVAAGFDPGLGAAALALVSLSYVVAQLAGGAAVDRFGTRPTAAVAVAVAGLGTAGVMTAGLGGPLPEARLLGSALLYGGGLAVLLLVRLAAFADRFAGPRFGLLSGIFSLAYPIGGSFIVWFGGVSFDLWRGYLPAFGVSAAGLVVAACTLLVVSRR